jgi:CRISPR/Cas system endoribonuclease Cas6 (RAMP superfamily)
MKITVPNEWMPLTARMLAELTTLKKQKDFETLNILYVREKEGHLRVAYELEPDVDELYEVIHNILKHYEKLMQAISSTKTSNIQGNTGGSCTAF